MLKYILASVLGLLAIAPAYAIEYGTPTTTASFTTFVIDQFYAQFWSPFGFWVLFSLVIAIAMMVYRRVRGTARRPH